MSCCAVPCCDLNSDNDLDGTISLLPSVVWDVDVSSNRLRGSLPALSRYTHLESFLAGNNNFNGEVPGGVACDGGGEEGRGRQRR
jgi:hypothetical protein